MENKNNLINLETKADVELFVSAIEKQKLYNFSKIIKKTDKFGKARNNAIYDAEYISASFDELGLNSAELKKMGLTNNLKRLYFLILVKNYAVRITQNLENEENSKYDFFKKDGISLRKNKETEIMEYLFIYSNGEKIWKKYNGKK